MRQAIHLCWLGLCALLMLSPAPARASIFGEENVTLLSILVESMQQSVSIKETLDYIRDTTAFARDTAGFAREAVQTGTNLRTMISHPEAFAAHSTQAWLQMFPQLEDILANVYDTEHSVDEGAHLNKMQSYDPYAYVRAFDRLRFATDDGFEVMAHKADVWGINTPHDAMLSSLAQQHEMAVDNLERLAQAINTSQLSPLQASVYTAQSSAISATAQVEAAATLQHIERTQKLQMMQQADEAARASDAYRDEMEATLQMSEPFVLDPLGRRTKAPPYKGYKR